MQIRRDYSQPFFSNRRKRRRWGLWIGLYIAGIAGFLFVVDSQFSVLQTRALSIIGQAPPPTPFASVYATNAMDVYSRGNVREAASLMEQAVLQQPTNVDYLYEFGRMLLELGDDSPESVQRAIEMGDRAIAANGNDPRGYALKARALDLSGDAAAAIPVAQAGLNVDRSFAPLYAALSSAYLTIDRYDVALENAERSIELDPLDPSARRIYSYSLVWVGRYDEAIDQLEQAIQLNPNQGGAYFELASLYRAQASRAQDTVMAIEMYADSIALYEQVLAMQPENARAYLRLCDAYFEARENQRATDYCQEAVTINPEYAQAWASLGQTQYSRRNYEGAIESFENCVRIAGDGADIRCYYLRGLAHYYLGECDDAWSILTDSINRIRAGSADANNPLLLASQEGLRLITVSCAAYTNRTLPTAVPPTAIPPTPIGG
ncbi:MAG: tetratricopeptide repeat protein [Pleurocapsa minor GSE-CHR-MK-17-07R]|jgi:tetratricopeptide (TPR) repeat protein|nr:tetratricopeptide repeat protein [Pleurocapsa minor GSE-CHR-MK 17-07R]